MGRLIRTSVQLSTLAGIVALAAGCSRDPKGTTAGVDTTTTTSPGSTGETDTSAGTTPTGTTTSTSEPPPTTTMAIADMGSVGGQCNLFLQDCPADQKCTAWNEDGGPFPNGTRCVPVDLNPALPGEDCVVPGKFGDGIDNCAKGSLCLDLENTGKATCVAYCTGSMDAPQCPKPEDRCAFLFEPTVPVCFSKCDPLLQDCSPGETCVPNEAALGAPHFVCMPRVFPDLGKYGDSCYALSGCDPGNLCIFGENLPSCKTPYCCSVWCDLESPDSCLEYDETLSCVPWFEEGSATPGYETVGICGIMQ
ncbi:hypothetical protein SAMN02745121_00618 [Nannocystis exedens]|uniref:Uncharacterized protein n=1 Tax=Nannocystis exedens TaxID=54 RepID=A0A1I1TBW7_9BACT|nr:hypothetical protein [Nannocystis exedens]PCC66656.1 hypothetical protein NAEX_09246 [Nannocystis exedens]SFD56114.1 hypothetical protein SAMN02745121_00618 [Nannocystis exedens]